MSGNPSSDPNFTGVKQPSFDYLVSKHSSAASQLDSLATRLWAELNNAGLDTTPAMRIREIARRVSKQAEDLRSRQRLVHQMARLGNPFGIGVCTPSGTYHPMPDKFPNIAGLLNGREAASLAKKAAAGDRKALAGLQKYVGQAHDPAFAKAFLEALGPKGLVEIPASLAKQIRTAADKGELGNSDLPAHAKSLLAAMSSSLAVGSDRKSPAYVGDGFLQQLKAQGRANMKVGETPYTGYQALSLIWRAHGGKPPYSPDFMRVVGADAIRFEKEQKEGQWKASKDALGSAFGGKQQGLSDLATVFNLGSLMDPGPPTARADGKGSVRASVIDNLFNAAAGNKEASQELFKAKLPDGQSVLTYMLTTRRDAFHDHENYRPFQLALQSALAVRGDDTAAALTNEALRALKGDIGSCFGPEEKTKELHRKDVDKLHGLAFLQAPLGQALATHIDKVSGVYDRGTPGFSGITPKELDKVLVFVARDNQVFKGLVRAQAERMRTQIDGSYRGGHGEQVENRILPEASLFGRLLEARRLALFAENAEGVREEQEVRAYVEEAISLAMTVPAGGLAARAGKAAVGEIGADVAGIAADKVAALIASQIHTQRLSVEAATTSTGNDKDLVAGMIGDMILGSYITHGKWSPEAINALKGKSFATTDDPPRIKDPSRLSPAELEQLVQWARDYVPVEKTVREANQEMNDSASNGFHESLGVSRY